MVGMSGGNGDKNGKKMYRCTYVRISVDRTISVPVLAMGSAGEWWGCLKAIEMESLHPLEWRHPNEVDGAGLSVPVLVQVVDCPRVKIGHCQLILDPPY